LSEDLADNSPQKKSKLRALVSNITLGLVLLISGISSLAYSIYIDSRILALAGLGLIFWGALFLLTVPGQRVDGRLLYDSVVASYSTIDRILSDFDYKGKGYYIPPYPKDAFVPKYLEAIKNPIVFISAKNASVFPSIEGIAEGKFLLKKPEGILINPPGLGLLEKIEKALQMDLPKSDLTELCEILPRSIMNFDLAEDISMSAEGNQVTLNINRSPYTKLYMAENKPISVNMLGCPIASTVACILSKATGQPITLRTPPTFLDEKTVRIQYDIGVGSEQ
jgi:hypothetical protein